MRHSRPSIARALSTLLAVTLALAVGGLTATSASAAELSAPQNVTLDWNGSLTALDIAWDPPAVIGSSPHVYQVYVQGYDQAGHRPYDNYSIVDYSTGGDVWSAPATDTNLRYTVSVWLHDNVQREWSPPGMAPPLPTAISDITGVSFGTDVTVTWTESAEHNEDAYDVLLTGPNGYNQSARVGDDPSFTFTDATTVGDYIVSVTATNASGSGPTERATVHVDGKDAPQPATNLVATDYSNQAVQATWDAPTDTGGLPLDEYVVVLRNVTSGEERGHHQGVDQDERWVFADIGDFIVPGDLYVVRVTAVNDRGLSPETATTPQTKVPSTVASAPRAVTAVSPATHQVAVTWQSPVSDGGLPVTDYIVTIDDSTVQNGDTVSYVPATNHSVTFNNIKAGTFGVTVTANNNNGESSPSGATVAVGDDVAPPTVAVVDDVAPNPPTQPAVIRVKDGGVVTITWQAPVGINGAPVTHYIVYVDGRRKGAGPSATSVHVKGLRKGPARVSVRAVNEFGASEAVVTTIRIPMSFAAEPKRTLRLGISAPAVRHLQEALGMRHHGGVFGKDTRRAVKDWQRSTGRDVTGVVSDRMRFLLAV
jgi:Fibronectin type III domain